MNPNFMNPTPAGATGMNRNATFLVAIRGPVIMITLGVIAALDQFGTVSCWRTWPVLLIVIGVMKLAERMGARTV